MQKIIVGVDFSPEADVAAGQAVEIARHIGGEVVLVHCGDTVEMPPAGHRSPGARQAFEAYRAQLGASLAASRGELAALRERLSGQGPVLSQMVMEGFPETALSEAAQFTGADLVVVGTHGRTGLRWFLLGSVAARVIRRCTADVLVARGERAGRGGFHRILVATDFSPGSERALDRGLDLAARGAVVDVVHYHGLRWPVMFHAGGPLAPLPPPPDPVAQRIAMRAKVRGETLIGPRRGRDVKLGFHALPGTPMPSIVHRLLDHPYDLVVLGGHRRTSVPFVTLGSMTEAVVRSAPCSVLIGGGVDLKAVQARGEVA